MSVGSFVKPPASAVNRLNWRTFSSNPNNKMKQGHIYLVFQNSGEVSQLEYLKELGAENIFLELPFWHSRNVRRIHDNDIAWVKPVCALTNELTANDYKDAIFGLKAN